MNNQSHIKAYKTSQTINFLIVVVFLAFLQTNLQGLANNNIVRQNTTNTYLKENLQQHSIYSDRINYNPKAQPYKWSIKTNQLYNTTQTVNLEVGYLISESSISTFRFIKTLALFLKTIDLNMYSFINPNLVIR